MRAIQPAIHADKALRIAIPMADGKFSGHFGAARTFLIFEGDRKTLRIGRKDAFGAPEHKPGALPKWLEQQQVDALVSSAIGERALIMLADAGIEVFLADGDPDPTSLATACLSGDLKRANMENSRCNGHHCDHGDGRKCHH
jgi:ATP-binding protein involved in chromosome partitioning